MARPKQAEFKPTVSSRVTKGELSQIDTIAAAMGQSWSEWLAIVVRQALGQNPPDTVKKMGDRVTALESKFNRLAG